MADMPWQLKYPLLSRQVLYLREMRQGQVVPAYMVWMKSAVVYNQLLNLGWTALGFAPLMVLWGHYYHSWLLAGVITISLLPFFIPADRLLAFRLSRQRRWYRRLGVKQAQAFTQNGLLVTRLIRKSSPGHVLIGSRRDLRKVRSQLLVFEKYHLACLIFFTLCAGWAALQQAWLLTLLILLANLFYNVYPILIQHYNKLRLPGL